MADEKEIKQIKIGNDTYDIAVNSLDRVAGLRDALTISGTVTKEIGGIAKNTTYDNASLETVLSDLLFPYVKPDITGLAIYNESSSSVSGTHEYGTSITVDKFKPTFTKGSKPITSIKVGTTSGGNDLYSSTSASSGTTYTLTNSKTYNGKTIGTNYIYCTIGDGEQTDSTYASIIFSYYPYAYTSSSTSVSSITSGAQKSESTYASSSFELTLSSESYV